MSDLSDRTFADRHIGPDAAALEHMLGVIGVASLDELAAKALPTGILDPLKSGIAPGLDVLGAPATEHQALAELRELSNANTVAISMIGQGYYDTLTPPVLLRNVLENPAWYTAYTPYQPEISQGRLEALLNFQTMIADLTGLDIANASMLDEATAAAEAMALMHRAVRGTANRVAVDSDVDVICSALQALDANDVVQLKVDGRTDLAGQRRLTEAIGKAHAVVQSLTYDLADLRLLPTAEDIAALRADGYVADVIAELREAQEAGSSAADQHVTREALAILCTELDGTVGAQA